MNQKPRGLTDAVLQCLVDKYMITYQNIWVEGMVSPHLVELGYSRILNPLKGGSGLLFCV